MYPEEQCYNCTEAVKGRSIGMGTTCTSVNKHFKAWPSESQHTSWGCLFLSPQEHSDLGTFIQVQHMSNALAFCESEPGASSGSDFTIQNWISLCCWVTLATDRLCRQALQMRAERLCECAPPNSKFSIPWGPRKVIACTGTTSFHQSWC